MGEKNTSQAHNDPWAEAIEQQSARMAAFVGELERIEAEHIERTCTAVDEMARLTRSTLDYSTRLTTEWRKMSMEAAQRSMALVQLGTK